MLTILIVLAILGGLAPANSQTVLAQPSAEWYVQGDWNRFGLSDPMQDDGTNGDQVERDGIFTAVVTIPTAGRHEFRVATADWNITYPGANSWIETKTANQAVTIRFDIKTHSDGWRPQARFITTELDPADWTAVGDWQGWDHSNPDTRMRPAGGGVYELTTTIAEPGEHRFKAVKTGTWDGVGVDGRSINAADLVFYTVVPDQEVTFRVHALSGRVNMAIQPPDENPTQDNNIWWDGLAHDSRDSLYRTPFGAVTTGTPVKLRFRTYHNDVTGVTVRVWNTAAGDQRLIPMMRVATTEDPPYGYDFWEAELPAQAAPTILWYRFIVRDGSDEDFYEDDTLFDGGAGAVYDSSPDYSYQVAVYLPDFETPEWMQNAVIYQIFPDRFYNGRPANDPKKNEPEIYGQAPLKKDWGDLPEGYCRSYTGEACEEEPFGRDFFGGDLTGVTRKLDYLKDLGVTAIYFNPIFMAPSNHLYDTTDYNRIDPHLGNFGDFNVLLRAAQQNGIRIILDGVFNHTSSDSLYFDRYSRYTTSGAFESKTSNYFDWYTFETWPGDYNSWFGFDSLPVLTEIDEVRAFIYGNENSVARAWLKLGASGWRLDVAPDKSHDFWQEFRPQVKSARQDAVIVGEIWDDASPWLLGNEFDSTMNYRFRRALIGFVNGETNDPNQGLIQDLNPEQFDSVLQSIREDYPEPAYLAMMNLVGSHDTQRILWALTPGPRSREAKELDEDNLEQGKTKLKLLALIQMTLPGAPTIYYGDEAGMTGDTDPDDRRPFPWDNIDEDLLGYYSRLTNMRSTYSFLRTGSHDRLLVENDRGLYAYGRKDSSGAAVVVVNRSDREQNVQINVSGYIPNGIVLTDGMRPRTLTVSGGRISVVVPGRSGVVLITNPGADLTPPAAPQNLAALAGASRVELSWDEVDEAAGYHIYRSPVSGGGYTRINNSLLSAAEYVDSAVKNGSAYYYVVTAVDAAGNESVYPAEVKAMPALVFGWANLQWPPDLTHVLGSGPTEYIYGQVWIDGLTNQPGATEGILAQVGYGPNGSRPDENDQWVWVDATYNKDDGNNDEYRGQLAPEAVGAYDYAYRYSTDGGQEWLYADLDGTNNGYSPAQAGSLTVSPPADTEAPEPPDGLSVLTASSSFIRLGWTASTSDDLLRYEVLRGSASGGPYEKVLDIEPQLTEAEDWTVTSGMTYYYVVRAVDRAFNHSENSNEAAAAANPRMVDVIFRVQAPESTPAEAVVHLGGSFNGWEPGGTSLTQEDDGGWSVTLKLNEGAQVEYKYTLGDWEHVEKGPACEELANRTLTVQYGTDGTMEVQDNVTNWRNTAPCGD